MSAHNQPKVENDHVFHALRASGRHFALAGLFFALWSFGAEARPLKVVSLDMCADQYALALLPKDHILGLSLRARHVDAYYKTQAKGIALVRPTVESLLKTRPDAVIRTWGGDLTLIAALKARGIKVIQINEAADFAQAGSEVVRVAEALGVPQAGVREQHQMQTTLNNLPKPGQGRNVLYYTPSAYSAGRDTWVGEVFDTLGFTMAASEPGYHYISPEVFIRQSTDLYALGFYDDAYAMRRTPGRHSLVRQKIAHAAHMTVPSPVLACSAWYSAYALPDMAKTATHALRSKP